MKEKCILCNKETSYEITTHISQRYGYIEGAGQLCKSCYDGNADTADICIPDLLIKDTPNDEELGSKIRNLFYEKKKFPLV